MKDYRRDHHGRVSKAEFNQHLPRWRCTVCGQWLYSDEKHTLKDCGRLTNLDAAQGHVAAEESGE